MLQQKIKKFATFLGLVLIALFLLLPFQGVASDKSPLSKIFSYPSFFSGDLETFEEVVDLISEKYVQTPHYKEMYTASIKEMVKTAGLENLTFETTLNQQSISTETNQIQYFLTNDADHNFTTFRKVYDFLVEEFKGTPSKDELEKAGIRGMMNSLDPYSQYLDKELFEKSMRDTEGKYGGLGMVISMKDYKLIVVKTMKNSPAERAGILPDDIITKVNGQELKNLQIQQLAEMLRGYPNTKVTISTFRPSEQKERELTLTREIIMVETVTYKNIGDRIAWIKIGSFSKPTNDQLKEAFAQGRRDGIKSIILDLRDNPGGLLDQSVKVASHFLEKNRLVVYTQGRDKRDRQEFLALYDSALKNIPLVLLINQHSASASEIVAGSLRDSGRAMVIGQNSYGKGSVQTIFRISDGSGLRLTTSKYYTPSGIDISVEKIVPEIKIIPEMLEKKESSLQEESTRPEEKPKRTALITLKESEVKRYLQKKGLVIDRENDPTLLLAHQILMRTNLAGKQHTLAKAREIASRIHF